MSGSVRVRGAGVVCALGVGVAAVCASVSAGAEFGAFRGPSPTLASYPAPFDARKDLPRGPGRRLGRQLAMSLAAVLEAVGEGPAWEKAPDDTGIVGSTAYGPMDESVEFVAGADRLGAKYASPLLFSSALHNSMAGLVARELGIRGTSLVVSNGEVSFETALLVATAGLSAGRMRRAIVVGADAFHPLLARSMSQFGMLSGSCDPIDPEMRRTTRGVLLGEGAGALVLDWDEGIRGVRLGEVHLGSEVRRRDLRRARVELMTTGDRASARSHADALAACGIDYAEVAYPAARFGAFASLSAVAIAVEAARRLDSETATRPTLFLAAPRGADAASVLLAGRGRC